MPKSYVSAEQLRQLRDACEQVLFAHTEDTRPVQTVAEEVGLAPSPVSFSAVKSLTNGTWKTCGTQLD